MLSASENDTGIEGMTEVDKGRVGMDIRTILAGSGTNRRICIMSQLIPVAVDIL
jgi:hypothetical protein